MKKAIFISCAWILFCAAAVYASEYASISGGGWYGWGTSIGDYYLSGSDDPLDLEGQLSGGNLRFVMTAEERWHAFDLWVDMDGSYLLTGSRYDVLRMDVAVGATARISPLPYLQPFVSAGLLFSNYLLLVPYNTDNGVTLNLWGARANAGIIAEVYTLRLPSCDLGFQAVPEYVFEILFSDTSILLQEIRLRLNLEMRFQEARQ